MMARLGVLSANCNFFVVVTLLLLVVIVRRQLRDASSSLSFTHVSVKKKEIKQLVVV